MRNQRGATAVLLALSRRRQAEFLFQAAGLLRRASKAEDRLGEMRVAGKGAVGRRHRGFRHRARAAIAIGLVRVEHSAGTVGDQRALRQIVDKCLGDVVAGMALAEMQNADGAGEQAEHADDRKPGEDRQNERLGHLARHHGEADGGNRQSQRKQHHEPNAAVPRGDGLRRARRSASARRYRSWDRQNSRFDLS